MFLNHLKLVLSIKYDYSSCHSCPKQLFSKNTSIDINWLGYVMCITGNTFVSLIHLKNRFFQWGPAIQRISSIFYQLIQLFPRLEFEEAVRKHNSDNAAKGFSSWGHFIAMLFCQFGRAHSLCEICGGLASCEGKIKHMGVSDSPKRSTLAYQPVVKVEKRP